MSTHPYHAANIPDLSGRTALVTGASGGLGLAITSALVARGARVIMPVRDPAKAERARARIPSGPGETTVLEADLMDLASVRRLAEAVRDRFAALDLLVNNAGISSQPLTLSAEGVESQFATNHLGHFALTSLLLDLLAKGEDPRVVTVVSALYKQARLDLDNLDGARGYAPGRAYNRSKLANVLFSRELQRRLESAGSPVRSFAAHPGMAKTPLHSTYPSPALRLLTRAAAAAIGRSAEDAAVPVLYAATAPAAEPGSVYGPSGPRTGPRVRPEPVTGPGADDASARVLWRRSEQLTGVTYPQRP